MTFLLQTIVLGCDSSGIPVWHWTPERYFSHPAYQVNWNGVPCVFLITLNCSCLSVCLLSRVRAMQYHMKSCSPLLFRGIAQRPARSTNSWNDSCCGLFTQSCLPLCDPMDCSTPNFPVFSLTPRVCSNSCPLSQWYHPTISSSVAPFSLYPQSFSA